MRLHTLVQAVAVRRRDQTEVTTVTDRFEAGASLQGTNYLEVVSGLLTACFKGQGSPGAR